MISNIEKICSEHGAELVKNAVLRDYTAFKIGGECDCLVKVNSCECIIDIIRFCKENYIRYYIIGNGSNILACDSGFRGVVICIGNAFSAVKIEENIITCEAGASLRKACRTALEQSLTGLEFAYGIPGTVGGAMYMNAGAYGGEMADVAVCCTYLDENLEIRQCGADKMKMGYRTSIFSEKEYIILNASFALQKGDKSQIENRMNELMQRRRDKQPLEYPSAGSTFKRPEGDFASRLIDMCGLKGLSCGGAQVSAKHAGFIINKNDASFADVMNLIKTVREKVREQTGITLECEVRILE